MQDHWKIIEHHKNVHVIKEPPGREWWALLLADVHFDNVKCDRDALARHLTEAKKREASVIVAGDFFCAMQGKWDKRCHKADLRPELQQDGYLDALVDSATEWLKPYADCLAVMGDGNHETGIIKRHETDILDRLCTRLRGLGSKVRHSGFSGWVRWNFLEPGGQRNPNSISMLFHHGAGQDPAVTKGLIENERMSAWVEGADIVLTGHIHQKNYSRTRCVRLNNSNVTEQREIHWLRCGSYQDDYQYGEGGFHIERNKGPRSMYGWWVRFYLQNHAVRVEITSAE